jgi:hypothetical protein
MGAATSIMYSCIDKGISAVITDSPFSSLHELIHEMVWSIQSWVPKSLIGVGVGVVGRTIQSRAGFDIELNRPIQYAPKCRAPIIMAHAIDDTFIRLHHSQLLFEAYGGDIKRLVILDGDHNSARDEEFYEEAAEFLHYWLVWRPSIASKIHVERSVDFTDVSFSH